MSAQDVTISLAPGSNSIKVYQMRTRDKNQIPDTISVSTIAASGSVVLNLGKNDTLLVERTDSVMPAINNQSTSSRGDHKA